jgi:fatty acid desaturase
MAIDLLTPASAVAHKPSFTDLRKAIIESGLLARQPVYYAFRFPLTLAMLVPGILALMLFDNIWIVLLNAVYLAVVCTQIVFLGHDCGHRQVFWKPFWNDVLALGGMPLVGVDYSWWCHNHNHHHSRPNEMGIDPAIEYDMFAFSESQAVEKKGLSRFLIRFQAFYFIPLTLLYPVAMRINSIRFILTNKPRYPVAEIVLFLIHFPVYFWLVFAHLSLGTGLIFVAVHQCLFSLFLVSTFAPNHKGLMILDEGHSLDFLHQQILTAQNVQSHPFADFWFGGLNYQIEHHLFPNMPRNKLKEAQRLVKAFCQEHAIPYQETKAPRCYWDILKFMHQASRPVRYKQEGLAVSPGGTALPVAAPQAGENNL